MIATSPETIHSPAAQTEGSVKGLSTNPLIQSLDTYGGLSSTSNPGVSSIFFVAEALM